MGVKSDRPTIPPSFNVEKFARDSERRMSAAAGAATPPSEVMSEMRLVTRPSMDAVTDDAWARAMTGTLHVRIDGEALKRLPIDNRAGFLLSLMDGTLDLETVVEVSGMPRDEVLRIVRDLYDSGIIDVHRAD
jgi:hypothetical protein